MMQEDNIAVNSIQFKWNQPGTQGTHHVSGSLFISGAKLHFSGANGEETITSS